MRKIRVGLIGLGTVGRAVAEVLLKSSDLIRERVGAEVVPHRAADLDLGRARGLELEPKSLTTDARAILEDPEVDIVVELIGGIEPAREYIAEAIRGGKSVVTANKALLAERGEELFRAASEAGVDLGFEASVGGGIPIIRALREGFAANRIKLLYGIVNGTSNYILSKMAEEGREFQDVLQEAQQRGYAEADPSLDVDGIDSAHKIVILSSLAFGTRVRLENVLTEGIRHITPLDIAFARELGYRIKPLGIAKKVDEALEVRVHATMLPESNPISQVKGVYNAIYVDGDRVDPNMFVGKGAGGMPTASAVVGDIIELSRNLLRGASGRVPPASCLMKHLKDMTILEPGRITSCYYLRFSALDRPGVLSKISGVLGEHDISIAAVIQHGRADEGSFVPVVMTTHEATEENVRGALRKIDELDIIGEPTVLIRVESGEGLT
ncbi:MAG: homoserine dehydrogenase [Nitrospinota bacterium]